MPSRGAVTRHGTLQVTAGHVQVPLCWTVNPNDVVAPGASVPFPLGFIVMTFPDESQVGVPFQVAMIFCGGVTVTVDVQLVMVELPVFLMVTVPLNLSLHFWPSE